MVDHIMTLSTATDAGRFWETPRHSFQGEGDSGVYTGFFYGAAGYGLSLLAMHRSLNALPRAWSLPDDPESVIRPSQF